MGKRIDYSTFVSFIVKNSVPFREAQGRKPLLYQSRVGDFGSLLEDSQIRMNQGRLPKSVADNEIKMRHVILAATSKTRRGYDY